MTGLIQRVNLYPCPVSMRNLTTSEESAGTGLDIKDGVATITPGSASNPYVFYGSSAFTPGDRLTLACRLASTDAVADNETLAQVFSRNWTNLGGWRKKDGSECRISFTVPADGYLHVRFNPGGGTLKVSRINIETTETFDESLPFFYYGTMPDPRSAS